MKSEKNRTIELTDKEYKLYLSHCLMPPNKSLVVNDVINKTFYGSMENVVPFLPAQFVDLMIADPPYNLAKTYNNNMFAKMTDNEYVQFTDNWLTETSRLLKPNASLYVCCDWKCSDLIEFVLKKKFNILNRITWQREKGRGAFNNWKNNMEDIWFCSVSKDYIFNVDDVKIRKRVIAPYEIQGRSETWEKTKEGKFRDTYPSNFWDDITVPFWSMPENTEHPTQKSEKLIAKLILASSNKGDIVFDPFLGSGTTSVTAKKLGRNYLGIEQEDKYCALAEKRLAMADTDKVIQGYADGVFWERNTTEYQKRYNK